MPPQKKRLCAYAENPPPAGGKCDSSPLGVPQEPSPWESSDEEDAVQADVWLAGEQSLGVWDDLSRNTAAPALEELMPG